MNTIERIRADLAAGFGLLTRMPIGWLAPRKAVWAPGNAVWTYPLAGLAIGAASAGCVWCAQQAGLAPDLGAAWTVALAVLLTGGLHEDGLADTADGFGGGRTVQRRLDIMRDSRIGSYGALALVLSLAVRIIAIGAMSPGKVSAALLVAGALSRGAMIPPLALLEPARPDGLGQGLGRIPAWAIAVAVVIATTAAFSLLSPSAAVVALVATGAASLAMSALAQRKIGGYTGDVLGACCVITEAILLTLLVAA